MNASLTLCLFTYKRPNLLKRALTRALDQTCSDFLIHVFDDASHDETEALVLSFQKTHDNIRYTCSNNNQGIILSVANALAAIETPYFSLLADDDFILPNFVETHLKHFCLHPSIGTSITRAVVRFEKGPLEYRPLPEGFFAPPSGAARFVQSPPFVGAIAFNTRYLKAHGGVKPEVGHIFDLDFFFRYAMHFPLYSSSEVTICHLQTRNCNSIRLCHERPVENFQCMKKLYSSLQAETHQRQVQDASVFQALHQWMSNVALQDVKMCLRSQRHDEVKQLLNLIEKKEMIPSVFFSLRLMRYLVELGLNSKTLYLIFFRLHPAYFIRKKQKQLWNIVRHIKKLPKPTSAPVFFKNREDCLENVEHFVLNILGG